MTRRWGVPAVLLAAVLALTGCASGSTGFSISDGGGWAPEPARDMASVEDSAGAPISDRASDGRQVVVEGSVWVTVDDPTGAADEVTRIVESAGGHIDLRSETAARDRSPGRAEMTVRIPADRLTTTLDDLAELGDVRERSITRTDVTGTVRDLDARITALETSVDRLLALMEQATTTADLITIESTLSERQADLEAMQAQRAALGDRVEYSTVSLYLTSSVDAPADDPDTFLTGLEAGWNALVAFGSMLLVLLGVLLPWLIVPAIVAVIVVVLVRRRRRRRAAVPVATAEAERPPAPPEP